MKCECMIGSWKFGCIYKVFFFLSRRVKAIYYHFTFELMMASLSTSFMKLFSDSNQEGKKKKKLKDQSNNNFRSVNIGKFGTWSQIVGTRMLLWVLTPFNDKIEFYHVYPKKKKNDKIALFGSSISFEIWSVLHTINKPCQYIIKIIWVIELYKSILHLIRV